MKTSSALAGFPAAPIAPLAGDNGGGSTPATESEIGSFADLLQDQVALQPKAGPAVPFADFISAPAGAMGGPKIEGATSSIEGPAVKAAIGKNEMANLLVAPSPVAAVASAVTTIPASASAAIAVSAKGAEPGPGFWGKKLTEPPSAKEAAVEDTLASSSSPSPVTLPSYLGATGILIQASLLASPLKTAAAPAGMSTPPTFNPDATAALVGSVKILAEKVSSLKIAGRLGALVATEKKSDETKAKGIFLQAPGLGTDSATTQIPAEGWWGGIVQTIAPQSLATSEANSTSPAPDLIEGASGSAGMANGKKASEMNATLDLPEIDLGLVSNAAAQASPDLDIHIVLGTNHDFQEALQQVMHVAEHSGLSPLTPPLRIAIEIQTPPGAVVNVYISRQHDQYRAQLSASDPQALSWVQDQIGMLRETTDADVAVRWLPAQLEPSAASDQKCSFTWGDQSQQGRQSNSHLADDRQQSRQRKPGWSGRVAMNDNFSNTLGALGRAA